MKTLFENLKHSFFVLVAAACLTSCATIVSGGDPSITIEGQVFEPVTIITKKQTYPNVYLPAVVTVDRHKLDGQRIQITSENYNYNDIVLEKAVNPWAFGNILLGGIIGLSVDLITNCVSKPLSTYYSIIPQPKDPNYAVPLKEKPAAIIKDEESQQPTSPKEEKE